MTVSTGRLVGAAATVVGGFAATGLAINTLHAREGWDERTDEFKDYTTATDLIAVGGVAATGAAGGAIVGHSWRAARTGAVAAMGGVAILAAVGAAAIYGLLIVGCHDGGCSDETE